MGQITIILIKVHAYLQLIARRALTLFKDDPLRTRRVLLLYKVHGNRPCGAQWTPFWLSANNVLILCHVCQQFSN